jgi:hypothetical protein
MCPSPTLHLPIDTDTAVVPLRDVAKLLASMTRVEAAEHGVRLIVDGTLGQHGVAWQGRELCEALIAWRAKLLEQTLPEWKDHRAPRVGGKKKPVTNAEILRVARELAPVRGASFDLVEAFGVGRLSRAKKVLLATGEYYLRRERRAEGGHGKPIAVRADVGRSRVTDILERIALRATTGESSNDPGG